MDMQQAAQKGKEQKAQEPEWKVQKAQEPEWKVQKTQEPEWKVQKTQEPQEPEWRVQKIWKPERQGQQKAWKPEQQEQEPERSGQQKIRKPEQPGGQEAAGGKADNEMHLEFDSRSCNEGFARVAVAAFMTQLNPTLEEVADVKTAVSEAVTNAIIHGYEGKVRKIRIDCRICGQELSVEVHDDGRGIADVALAMQPLYTTKAECDRAGMGFAFMEAFMDTLEVRSKPGCGTTVRMTKRIVREQEQGPGGYGRDAGVPKEEAEHSESGGGRRAAEYSESADGRKADECSESADSRKVAEYLESADGRTAAGYPAAGLENEEKRGSGRWNTPLR